MTVLTSLFSVAAAVAAMLMPGNAGYLRLQTASAVQPPAHMTQIGLAIFDIEVNADGQVADKSLMQGDTPFVQRSRLALDGWHFMEAPKNSVHVNATFLYKPQMALPDSRSAFNLPRTDTPEHLTSPLPIRIVDPGYPTGGMSGGEVIMQTGLDTDGSVRSISVIGGPPALASIALSAARQWKFDVPADLDPLSRTAVISMYFEPPKTEAGNSSPTAGLEREAVFVSGQARGIPAETSGILATDNSASLAFRYGDSHWTLPYGWITEMKYDDTQQGGDLLSINFSETAGQPQTITFRLARSVALSAAAALSSRSGKPIEFAR